MLLDQRIWIVWNARGRAPIVEFTSLLLYIDALQSIQDSLDLQIVGPRTCCDVLSGNVLGQGEALLLMQSQSCICSRLRILCGRVCCQDCGKPYYTTNYLAFFNAIKERYPDMVLIANCNMGQDAPTEMWDWYANVHASELPVDQLAKIKH